MQKFIIRYSSLLFLIWLGLTPNKAKANDDSLKVMIYEIREEISKPAWRSTQLAFEKAEEIEADYMLIHINTYGGRVDIADSIRTKILNSSIPVIGFIDNQAISAGALISISCDSIYMRTGGSIGAATVVDQSGQQVPDKYQSFMRSTMRATAEAHGKDTVVVNGDTSYVWHRNPKVAEAMVDPRIFVPGISDSGQVLTLTAEEAIKVEYCEGMANNIQEVLESTGLQHAVVERYKPEGIEVFIRFLLSNAVQGILIILIIGGIFFELQTPGIGFPLGIAVAAALLFFAPLYLEGLAENWELLVFIAGIVLIGLEVFVIPGFGIAGVAGIIMVLTGLTLSLVDNIVFDYQGLGAVTIVVKALLQVILSVFIAFVGSILISNRIGKSNWFKGLALDAVQKRSDGFVSIDTHIEEMVGKSGVAYTVLRPSGRIMIDDELFDAKSEIGYIEKGEKIKVIRDEAGQLYVIKLDKS
jgi:membrane-bound serine protease (ClpP class)